MAIHRTTKSLIFTSSVIDAMKKKTVVGAADCMLPEGEPVRVMCEKQDGDCLVRSIVGEDTRAPGSISHGWCLTSRENISRDPDYSIQDPDSLFERLKSRTEAFSAKICGNDHPEAPKPARPNVDPIAAHSWPEGYHYRSTEDFERGIDTHAAGFWSKRDETPAAPAVPQFTVE